ncbi:MAG: nucleotidyltransferase domain-containing protein [Candidatus Poribacteria bacterium]|nr:nucleotidyltransferase domain-containing protein [Candidatus Poribacteria bacterium]
MTENPKKNTCPETSWTSLRPKVTETLLADITQRIVAEFHPNQVILFGSYADGKPNANSDVDLLVVMDSNEPMTQRAIRVAEVAQVRFLPMDILVYTRDEITERLAKGDFFIIEILTTGKVLYRYDPG